MKKWSRGLLAAVCVAAPLISHAAYESLDSRFGLNSLIRDTESGTTFLRFDLTYQQSYDDVLAATADGGLYEGFRYAGNEELKSVFRGVQAGDGGWPGTSPDVAQQTAHFIELMGGNSALHGFTASDPDQPGRVRPASTFLLTPQSRYDDLSLIFKNHSAPEFGSFLVTAPVPEPETWVLILGGLGWVSARVRSRRTAFVGKDAASPV